MAIDVENIHEIDAVPPDQSMSQVDDARAEGKTLLTMDEEMAGRAMVQEWEESRQFHRREMAQWQVNRARELGYIGVSIVKVQDENRAHIPLGSSPSGQVMNKAARLKRRLRSTLFADKPLPEATPATDADEDRDSAEIATRVLIDVTSEGKLDFSLKAGAAFDLGGNYGSGYIEFWVDEYKNGWVPQQVYVHPMADRLETAIGPEGEALDPITGRKILEVTEKYVNKDGSLTADLDSEAVVRVWLPGLGLQCLTGKNVRPLPSTVDDIWEAEGLLIGRMVPWGQLRALVPELAELPEDELNAIVTYRPQHVKDIMPPGRKDHSHHGRMTDEMLVFVLKRWNVQCFEYPKAFYALVVGDGHVVERGPHYDEANEHPMDIPVTQFKQYEDEGNVHGVGIMTHLGPGFEARAVLHNAMFEHLDRFNRRKLFIPTTSMLTPEQLQSPTQTVISVMPNQEPSYEQVPDFPESTMTMEAKLDADMDDEAGLKSTAQALEAPSVKSGLHAQRILEQVNVILSDLKQNTERGLIRGYRVMLQLIRAHFDRSQQVRYLGADSAYKVDDFSGADLGSTQDVRLQRGSFTQLAPSAKAALAQAFTEAGFFNPQELEGVITGNVGGMVGVQDNPHRLRVRRQIAEWVEGPPEDWKPPQPQVDPQTGQPAIDPQTGQPMQPEPDPVLSKIFDMRASDEDQEIAMVREYELARAVAGSKFSEWPPEWQEGILQAYSVAFHAAGKMTIAEQQALAQQQAEAAKQAAIEIAEAESRENQRDRDAKMTGDAMGLDVKVGEGSAERELKGNIAKLDAAVAIVNPVAGEESTETDVSHLAAAFDQ